MGIEDNLLCHHVLNGIHNVGQFSDTGGLDDDAVRPELIQDLTQGCFKITHQRAADTAGVHLVDLDTGILQESAVNPDLPEFIFNQYDLLPLQGFFNQFFDQCCFSGAKKAGDNIYFCHVHPPFQTNLILA